MCRAANRSTSVCPFLHRQPSRLSAGNRFDMIERKLLPNEAWTRTVEPARRR
jgi:hypothetical protein